jgi:hypothetical protein
LLLAQLFIFFIHQYVKGTNPFLMQKEEFQHTAYSTNAYVTMGPLSKQLLQGKGACFSKKMLAYC